MNQKQFLIRGTFLLTIAGIGSRFLGFFYRVFLSRTIGAEGIGIFQLILPVSMFCTAVAAGGIQTAISRYCAEYYVKKQSGNAERILACGLVLSVSLAVLTAFVIYGYSDLIAIRFLAEKRCAPLLRITAFSLPFAVIHACFCGFFIGIKQVRIPAAAQMAEQLTRIGSVFLLYYILQKGGHSMSFTAMAFGQVAGEISSALLCTLWYLGSRATEHSGNDAMLGFPEACRKILTVSAPLGLNRMFICVLQGIEAALLPQQLILYGLTSSEALALYGTMSGMVLPLLLFPTAVTGALGTLLLPAVSEARITDNGKQLSKTIEGSFCLSFILGIFFFSIFALFGSEIGWLLFGSTAAGQILTELAWLCPFLYLNTTLVHILHGLGKTFAVSLQNTLGFLGRLAAVFFLVPVYGIKGYSGGLFGSQIFIFAASLYTLHHNKPLHLPVMEVFLKPLASCMFGICCYCLSGSVLPYLRQNCWGSLILNGCIFMSAFFTALWIMPPQKKIPAAQK